MEKKNVNLRWYYYLSYWIFIWFILFKLDLIKYSPYVFYIFILFYFSIKILQAIPKIFKKKKNKTKNFNTIIVWFIIIFIDDILPIIFLKKQIDEKSIYISLIIIILYIIFMNLNKINILDHYSISNFNIIVDNYTAKEFLKKIFF